MAKIKFILVGVRATESDALGGVGTLSNALIDYANREGYKVSIVDTSKKPFSKKNFFRDIRGGLTRIYQLVVILFNEKYNGIIILSGAGWGFYERILMSAICRIASLPCILIIVDGWFFSIRGKCFVTRWWISQLLKIPTSLVASGSNWKILFSELGVKDSRIVTIHYWLPKSFPVSLKPKMLSANEFPKFIFVGWMIKEKGVREILAALDSLIDEYSFTFTFVGAGPMLDYVIESIRNSKWESRVFAKGWLSNQQKEMELSTSHVFILPSYAEGFPMSLIEALSFGLPAICSDVGGISDSLHDGENGFLIPPKNIPALKEAMEFYIKNPNILIKHSLKSLEVVRGNHEVEMNCKKLFDTLLMSRD